MIVIILIAIVGAFALTQNNGKVNTQISFLSQSTLKNGEQVQIELKDAQGNVIAGQSITISYDQSGNIQNYTLVTDDTGKAFLTLNGEQASEHQISATYDGNDKYNGCSAQQTITIEDSSSQTSTSSNTNSTASTNNNNNNQASSSSSSNQKLYYDSEINAYYDSNGIIRGGQNDGYSLEYIKGIYREGNVNGDGNLE